MPKFHFEIVDGYTIEDPRGIELPTEQQAERIAEEMAKQIAIDAEDRSLTDVVVKDGATKTAPDTRTAPHRFRPGGVRSSITE